MGGTFSVIYSAKKKKKIKNLITTVTPSNFDTDKGLLHIWMKDIDVERMIRTFGNIPGDLMNFGFLLLNPARLMIDKYVGFMENMDNRDFVENFVRMERWIFDSPDVPGETFRQFVEDCYKNNLLIQSKMHLDGKKVDLKNLTMPLINFYGEYDHLVPPEACNRLTSAVGSKDTQDVCLETGHIGIYVSSKFQRQFAPRIAQWLKERDQTDQAELVRKQQSVSDIKKQAAAKKPKTAPKVKNKRAAKPAGTMKKPLSVPQPIHQTTAKRGRSLLIQKISGAI